MLLTLAALVSVAVTALTIMRAPDHVAHITSHDVKFGDTLSSILSPAHLSGTDIMEIANLLKKDGGVRKLKADSDTVKIHRPTEAEPAHKVVVQSGPWRQIEFTKADGTWTANPIDIEKDVQIVLKSGEIKDGDSFYTSGIRAGIPESVLADAYDLLAFEMDFERDLRAGQQFSLLYEENFADGEFVEAGSIVALKFDAGKRGVIKMYRFVKSNGRPGYYDENGGGAIKSLKRTPINNARVTSSFNGRRKHPVLGYTRAHKGIDFRAGTGTPIPSAGGGRVVKRGWTDGYGNYIRIRHNASYETLYAHLSQFRQGTGVGTTVNQGQIVGYVGSTGISTGPHLHYEIIKDGRHVNPMTVKLPAIDNLTGNDKKDFLKLRPRITAATELLKQFPTLVIY